MNCESPFEGESAQIERRRRLGGEEHVFQAGYMAHAADFIRAREKAA